MYLEAKYEFFSRSLLWCILIEISDWFDATCLIGWFSFFQAHDNESNFDTLPRRINDLLRFFRPNTYLNTNLSNILGCWTSIFFLNIWNIDRIGQSSWKFFTIRYKHNRTPFSNLKLPVVSNSIPTVVNRFHFNKFDFNQFLKA